MATTRKAVVDPLIEELPPEQESKPTTAADVSFEIEIMPYVVSGETYFRWIVVNHNAREFIGDYSGHTSVPDAGLRTASEAEANAREYVGRVRHAVELKLNVPDSYRIFV